MTHGTAKEIHRRYDEYGPIHVFDEGPRRYLAFGNDDEQSCQLISQPHILQHEYTRAIVLVLLMSKPELWQRITLIGVGGGGLISSLFKLLPHIHIEAVELRASVIKVAHKYFQLPRTPQLSIHINDGLQYLIDASEQSASDLIITDMYDAGGIDHRQLSERFISLCQNTLNDNGWLVLNCWLDHRENEVLMSALAEYFGTLYRCDCGGGNWIVYACNDRTRVSHVLHESQVQHESKAASSRLHCRQQQATLSQQAGFSLKPFYREVAGYRLKLEA